MSKLLLPILGGCLPPEVAEQEGENIATIWLSGKNRLTIISKIGALLHQRASKVVRASEMFSTFPEDSEAFAVLWADDTYSIILKVSGNGFMSGDEGFATVDIDYKTYSRILKNNRVTPIFLN